MVLGGFPTMNETMCIESLHSSKGILLWCYLLNWNYSLCMSWVYL